MRVFLKERLNNDEDVDHHHQEDHDNNDARMLAEPILNDTSIKPPVFNKKHSSLKNMISLMKTRYIYIRRIYMYRSMLLLYIIPNHGYGFYNAAPYSFKH